MAALPQYRGKVPKDKGNKDKDMTIFPTKIGVWKQASILDLPRYCSSRYLERIAFELNHPTFVLAKCWKLFGLKYAIMHLLSVRIIEIHNSFKRYVVIWLLHDRVNIKINLLATAFQQNLTYLMRNMAIKEYNKNCIHNQGIYRQRI